MTQSRPAQAAKPAPPDVPATVQPAAVPDLRTKRKVRPQSSLDRLPPHSTEAEQGVLGCCLLSPNECVAQCASHFRGVEAFYDLRHQTIYTAMVEMWDRRDEIDIITLQQVLKDKGLLDEVGGLSYLSSLPDVVPSAANLEYYVGIVKEKHTTRKLIQFGTELVAKGYASDGDPSALLDEAERDVMLVRGDSQSDDIPIITDVQQSITAIEEYHQRQGALAGLGTGLSDLDRITGGMCRGQTWVIAARPSVGKTSLALNIACNVGIREGKGVAVFTGESGRLSLSVRMICSEARIDSRLVRQGQLTEADFPKIMMAADKISKSPIRLVECFGWSIMQLRAKARRLVQRYGIELLVFDYIQKFRATNSRGHRIEKREQEVAEISAGLSNLAKECNVAVLALSQLNRLGGDKPDMSNLRESGSLEQDGDVIGILYRPEKKKDDEPDHDADDIILDICKQRDGPTGPVHLTFLKQYTRFESTARIRDADCQ